MTPLPWKIIDDRVRLGDWFALSFQRTLRIPDDGRTYPLPPGLGRFPVVAVEEVRGRLPADWRGSGGALIPLYQREALWLSFEGPSWHPCAAKVGVGRVNAITGAAWDDALLADPQDYLVCPHQPWLDGIKTGAGLIRQFVAAPLGRGDTVEAQVSGREGPEALRLLVYEPQPGRFPDQPPPHVATRGAVPMCAPMPVGAMGLGAGGSIRQKVYPDPHGITTWVPRPRGGLVVHIVDSRLFREFTGRAAPPSPIDAATYARYKLPWFDLYDEGRGDLDAPDALAGVRSVRQREAARGLDAGAEDTPVPVDESTVNTLRSPEDPRPPQD